MECRDKTIAILVEKLYNDREFWYPYYRLREAGGRVLVTGPAAGRTYNGAAGIPVKAEVAAADLDPAGLDGVVIPGGYAPDHMRRHPAMVNLVRQAARQDKVVAAICHGGWMLASAGVLAGRTVTGFFAIRDDLVNAGATYVDEPVVVDGNLITSRTPDDLPAFLAAIIKALAG